MGAARAGSSLSPGSPLPPECIWRRLGQGSGGASCETVCSARGGCLEEEWPTSEEEFEVVTKQVGMSCESVQHGGAKYDPSTDGRHCGWGGPDEANSKEARCTSKGDDST